MTVSVSSVTCVETGESVVYLGFICSSKLMPKNGSKDCRADTFAARAQRARIQMVSTLRLYRNLLSGTHTKLNTAESKAKK